MTPVELHDRYWATRGVQVVRLGERSQTVDSAELYLLTDPRSLAVFSPHKVAERAYWCAPNLSVVRIRDRREQPYVERVISDDDDNFVRFERHYARRDTRLARVALTRDRAVADAWQAAKSVREGWREIRSMTDRHQRLVDRVEANVYDSRSPSEQAAFVIHLISVWPRPDTTIERCKSFSREVWTDPSSDVSDDATFDGPVWIGAGRTIRSGSTVLGPAVVWDDPTLKPDVEGVRWRELEPTPRAYANAVRHARGQSWLRRKTKRAFDILFATAALTATAPVYPIVMLAIWLEDGRPFFFGHTRETLGGREFRCLKFRSMRKNAEAIKVALLEENQADGPQFFIKNDPRLTRVGKLIRRFNVDELPQFINVLRGHMSVVGPRPSPRRENQFCPAWREARLSVRPGITGLWQIMRTRRRGMDFQEWIRYDLEYVERVNLRTDLSIIGQTIYQAIRGRL